MATPALAEGLAARDWRPRPFRVVARHQETPDTWTLELEGEASLDFVPGQFTMLAAGGHGEVPISISGDPGRPQRLVQTVRAVGLATRAICAAPPGAVLGVRGPFGRGWPLAQAHGGDLVIVAGGVGLAPVRCAIYAALADAARFTRILVLYGSREPELLLYKEELLGWTQAPQLELAVTVDAAGPAWRGSVGVVPQLIERARFEPSEAVGLVVGPEVMMRFAVAALQSRGVADERIHVSLERNMQCGFGVCGHCQLGPLLICRDGPVFSYAQAGAAMRVREL
jgi:NAD(P)H-flavin reductase